MSKSITLTIQFFGALRKYATDKPLCLVLPKQTLLSDVRLAIIDQVKIVFSDFNEDGLLNDSVFADDTQILPEDKKFEADAVISILPPVCGG